jgi:hypothetical protein
METLTRRRHWTATLFVGAALLGGCGDPLVDRRYLGEPLLTVRGNVTGSSDALPLADPLLRISVWWSPEGLALTDHSKLLEQPSIATQSTVPFSFTLNVFDIPTSAYFSQVSDGVRYAVGSLMGYYDGNGNAHRDENEPFLGSTRRLLWYAPQAVPADQSPIGRALASGYAQTSTSFACPPSVGGSFPPPPPAPSGADCSQKLGAACTQDTDCAPGICIRDFVAPWPQGGCVLPDPLPAGCGPQGAMRVTAQATMDPRRDLTYWVKACASSEDCGRSFPYQCDVSLGACLPTGVVTISLSDSLPAPRWCRKP